MITYTSTPQEIFEECTLIHRATRGILAKAGVTYNTFRKHNKKPIAKRLSYQTTLINHNKVHIWLFGVGDGRCNIIRCCYVVEYPNKHGQPRYLSFVIGNKRSDYTLILYTHHFCVRLKERFGITFTDWMDKNLFCDTFIVSKELNENHDVICILNDTFCIAVKETPNIIRMITCVNKDQEFLDQNLIHEKCMAMINAFDKLKGLKNLA